MFYENVDFQFASFHTNNNRNNNCHHSDKLSHRTRRLHVVLLGDRNTGKSKLIRLLVDRIFEKKGKHRHSLDLIYQCEDRSIEERLHIKFSSIHLNETAIDYLHSHQSSIDCIFLTYDLSNALSFYHLMEYSPLILQKKHVLIGIVNPSSPREIHRDQVKIYIQKYPLVSYEISLKGSPKDFFKDFLDHYFHT